MAGKSVCTLIEYGAAEEVIAKVMVLLPGVALESVIACRNEPVPESSVLLTT